MSVIVSNQKLPHSHIDVGVYEFASQLVVRAPGFSCFELHARSVANSTTLPTASVYRDCQSNNSPSSSNTQQQQCARRVSAIPADSMVLVSLGRCSWPSRRASLPRHPALPPLPALLAFVHVTCQHRFESWRRGPNPCGRSLLLLSLWLATGMGCVLFVCRSAVCLDGASNSHQSTLQSKPLIHDIVGPVNSVFEPEVGSSELKISPPPEKILWFWTWEQNPNKTRIAVFFL